MKFPTVIRLPIRDRNIWPTRVVTETEGGEMIHCHSEKLAKRVARALDLLEAVNGAGPERISQALDLQDRLDSAQSGDACIVSRGIPLPESEILTRAREAAIAWGRFPSDERACRAGEFDDGVSLGPTIRALRDLAKPLSEVVPAPEPDRDVVEAKIIRLGEHSKDIVELLTEAIRRGRELEREASAQDLYREIADRTDSQLGKMWKHPC